MRTDKRNPVTLRFASEDLETAFYREYAEKSTPIVRTALLLALVLYVLLGVLDPWMMFEATEPIWLIRAAVCTLILLVYAFTYLASFWRYMQASLSALVLAAGSGIVEMMLIYEDPGAYHYYAGLMLVLIFAHEPLRLRFIYATLACWTIIAAYLGGAFGLKATPPHLLINNAFFLISANLIGMFASYSRENYARTVFLQNEALERQDRALKEALAREQQASEALKRSEQRVRHLVDSMNEGLVTVDAEGRITWANRSLCEMFGYALEEMLGHHPTEYLDEANRQIFRQEFTSRKAGSKDRYEVEWIRKDGSRFSSVVAPQPLYAEHGLFSGSVAVINDITPIKEAEKALRQSEARIRAVFSSAAVGFAVVDQEGRLTRVNQHLAELSGYTEAELLSLHYLDLIPREDRPAIRNYMDRFYRGEAPFARAERAYLRKDGTTFYGLLSPAPLLNREGQVQAVIVSIVDITDLRQAEEALEKSERHYRELVNYASSIILRWSAEGTIRFVNPYGLRFFGYAEDELVGQSVIGTIVPKTDSSGKDLVEMIRDITVHPERYLYNENEIRDKAGRRYWIVWTNRPLLDGTGQIAEILSIGTDITELKEAREALARQRDDLAELNRFIRQVFGRYLSDQVVKSLLESPEGLKVGGSKRMATILLADIRGFSSLAESMAPEQVVALLNAYLETMTTVIQRYEGTIDEFIGDAILVIFGAPIAKDDDATRAVACALAMQLAMEEVNTQNRMRGLPEIEMGIGINTGEVIVGNIGSVKRAKYGVVGASVNLASRIESYTVGGQILISGETLRATGDLVEIAGQVEVEPKGVNEPLTLYEVGGMSGTYDLRLPTRVKGPIPLPFELPFRYTVLEEKFAGRTLHEGRIVQLSELEAEVACSRPLPLLSNLKLLLADETGQEIPGDVYAKVIKQSNDKEQRFRLRFTSLSPAARHFLRQFD